MKWGDTLFAALLVLSGATGYEAPAKAQPASAMAASLPQPPTPGGYQILPRDLLDIRVFNEPELSVAQLPVDAAGNVNLPLVGEVRAAGKSAPELSEELRAKLTRYIVSPRVAVMVTNPIARKIMVDGQVMQPGLYDLPLSPTLMSSLAQARGLTNVAKQSEILVLREIDGHRYAARFDIKAIHRGEAPDPEIVANDKIIVGLSAGKAIARDLLSIAPLLTAVFVRLD